MPSNPYGLSSSGLNLYTGLTGLFGEENVIVTSGGRSASHNANVGGTSNSQHIGGNALDFSVPGMSSAEVATIVGSSGMQYGQLIGYSSNSHVHIGAGSKKEDLLKKGKNYVKTVWDKATGKTGEKVAREAIIAGANAVLPGVGGAVAETALNIAGVGEECDWFCKIKKWFDEKQLFQRAGLFLLAIVIIFAAFYLLGTGQVQKLLKEK